jgi:hypothetical protein
MLVVLPGEDQVLIVVLVPKGGLDGERPQRGVDCQRREAVDLVVEHAGWPSRMLISAVPQLESATPSKRGNEHAIEVHETQLGATYEDIAMLEIAMGDMRCFKLSHQPCPLLRKVGENFGPLDHLSQIHVQGVALQPLHHEDRIRRPIDADSRRVVFEFHDCRKRRRV